MKGLISLSVERVELIWIVKEGTFLLTWIEEFFLEIMGKMYLKGRHDNANLNISNKDIIKALGELV